MADMVGEFPVLGRYKLSRDCEGPATISAALGRPIVLIEHHEALASGLDLLSAAAAAVNSLGDIVWCSTEAMLRSNYFWRQQDTTLWLKPYSSRIQFRVPDGVGSVAVASEDGDAAQQRFRLMRRT